MGDLKCEIFCESTPRAAEVRSHSPSSTHADQLLRTFSPCARAGTTTAASGTVASPTSQCRCHDQAACLHTQLSGVFASDRQTGDPSGSGKGGQSIWGRPFADEIRAALRFNQRGIMAMASNGRDSNKSAPTRSVLSPGAVLIRQAQVAVLHHVLEAAPPRRQLHHLRPGDRRRERRGARQHGKGLGQREAPAGAGDAHQKRLSRPVSLHRPGDPR